MFEEALRLAALDRSAAVDVEGLRAERATIRRACARIQELLPDAMAADAADLDVLTEAVTALLQRWNRHVRLAEAPDGLLHQIVTDSPRLSTTVARISREHPVVVTQIRSALELLGAPDPDLASVRRLLGWAMDAMEQHRRRGNQLIYDAYNLDIGLSE
ncbi:MAG: hypothetical protein WAL50_19395 [Kineosporiaceae bacterium]|jgi:hypothetical protein